MLYEKEATLLLDSLRIRWGDDPGWTLRPNKEHGFFLLYRREAVPLREVRSLIESTFGFAHGPTFILGDLPEPRGEVH